jgi:hypothetical protein
MTIQKQFPGKSLTILISLVFVFLAACLYAADHKYVGVATCKMCHKGEAKGSQYEIWETSKHAKAIDGLKTSQALEIAKAKGLKVPPSEAPECLKCHTAGFGSDASLFDAKFDVSMGVQCEACHGAGGDYKAIGTMKDRQKAIENGLNPILVSDGTAAKHCQKCHNQESPVFKGFNFDEYWAKIKHPRPKQP